MNLPSVVTLVNAAAQGDPAGVPAHLCSALCSGLAVDGATISLMTQTSWRQFFGAAGTLALELEELQFGVGEGPCITAAETGKPVIVPDLHTVISPWPIFGPARREQLPDIGAIYAFPMPLQARTCSGPSTGRRWTWQAKGMLAARWDVHPEVAFQSLRAYARSRQRKLHEVALDLVERRLEFPR